MRRLCGTEGSVFAKVVSRVLRELLNTPKNGLEKDQRGAILVILDDSQEGDLLSVWDISVNPRDLLSWTRSLACGRLLMNNPDHLGSRQSAPDAENLNQGVAIRIKIGSKKRLACLYGLTAEANEAVLILASVGKNYLDPELAVKILEESRNELVFRLKRRFLRH